MKEGEGSALSKNSKSCMHDRSISFLKIKYGDVRRADPGFGKGKGRGWRGQIPVADPGFQKKKGAGRLYEIFKLTDLGPSFT